MLKEEHLELQTSLGYIARPSQKEGGGGEEKGMKRRRRGEERGREGIGERGKEGGRKSTDSK